ncbi:hypothetical protein AB0C96_04210 [Streptomyces sp. NPDC048506]|uniref:hypothetical protein n=1 Tax=Streptomyces sp. NPDC048506 TaxID=3155028 RepID=UPI0034314F38
MLEAFLGAAGGIIAAVIGAWAALRARHPREAELELVDVSASQGESRLVRRWEPERNAAETWSHVAVLDVKLRNRGDRTAVLKRLELTVEGAGQFGFSRPELLAALPSSATYDITLSPPRWPHHTPAAKDLSQVIPAGEADRFEVRLHVHAPDDLRYLYRLHLDLVYNGDDRRVSAGSIAVAFPHPPAVPRSSGTRRSLEFREGVCSRIVDILAPATFMSGELRSTLGGAQATLRQLSTLRDGTRPGTQGSA